MAEAPYRGAEHHKTPVKAKQEKGETLITVEDAFKRIKASTNTLYTKAQSRPDAFGLRSGKHPFFLSVKDMFNAVGQARTVGGPYPGVLNTADKGFWHNKIVDACLEFMLKPYRKEIEEDGELNTLAGLAQKHAKMNEKVTTAAEGLATAVDSWLDETLAADTNGEMRKVLGKRLTKEALLKALTETMADKFVAVSSKPPELRDITCKVEKNVKTASAEACAKVTVTVPWTNVRSPWAVDRLHVCLRQGAGKKKTKDAVKILAMPHCPCTAGEERFENSRTPDNMRTTLAKEHSMLCTVVFEDALDGYDPKFAITAVEIQAEVTECTKLAPDAAPPKDKALVWSRTLQAPKTHAAVCFFDTKTKTNATRDGVYRNTRGAAVKQTFKDSHEKEGKRKKALAGKKTNSRDQLKEWTKAEKARLAKEKKDTKETDRLAKAAAAKKKRAAPAPQPVDNGGAAGRDAKRAKATPPSTGHGLPRQLAELSALKGGGYLSEKQFKDAQRKVIGDVDARTALVDELKQYKAMNTAGELTGANYVAAINAALGL